MAQRPQRPERPQRDRLADELKRKDMLHRRKNPIANPLLTVELSGNAEQDSQAQHEAFQGALSKRMKEEDKRFNLATDSEYYVVVCFQTRVQKEHFLRQTGWDAYGDKYLDGYYVAEKLGVDLHPSDAPDLNQDVPYNTSSRIAKALPELVRDDER